MANRKTYTVEEAAEVLGLSRNSAYEGIRSGDIPAIRVGRRLLIPKVALDRLLREGAENGNEGRVAKAEVRAVHRDWSKHWAISTAFGGRK